MCMQIKMLLFQHGLGPVLSTNIIFQLQDESVTLADLDEDVKSTLQGISIFEKVNEANRMFLVQEIYLFHVANMRRGEIFDMQVDFDI